MTWISVKENPPKEDIVAVVCNDKGWMTNQTAIYHKIYDVWVLYRPHDSSSILLEVTHYIPIPAPIRRDE